VSLDEVSIEMRNLAAHPRHVELAGSRRRWPFRMAPQMGVGPLEAAVANPVGHTLRRFGECTYITYIFPTFVNRTRLMSEDRRFEMRASAEWLKKLDEWRRKQADLPSRAEAIRRLVEAALKTERIKR